jgi:hypothetical protein
LASQAFAFLKAARAKVDWNGACFAAGTNVIIGINPDGSPITRSIEEIEIGDYVLSRDQYDAGDDLNPHQVTQVFRKTSDHIRVLRIQGDDGNVETIRTTDTHPFWVQNKGWTGAADLVVGDLVQESDGTWQAVLGSERQAFANGVTVYNLEVAGDHTYFVEDGAGPADAVWVHNICVQNTFFGRSGLKPIGFAGVSTRTKQLSKVSQAAYDKVTRDLENRARPAFLKSLAMKNKSELRKVGFSDKEISNMAQTGVLPAWAQRGPRALQVHHIQPKDVGGANDFDNLVLMKNSPHHNAITQEVRAFTAHMERGDGQVIEMELPTFEGMKVYVP